MNFKIKKSKQSHFNHKIVKIIEWKTDYLCVGLDFPCLSLSLSQYISLQLNIYL